MCDVFLVLSFCFVLLSWNSDLTMLKSCGLSRAAICLGQQQRPFEAQPAADLEDEYMANPGEVDPVCSLPGALPFGSCKRRF